MGHAFIFDLIERGYFWPETMCRSGAAASVLGESEAGSRNFTGFCTPKSANFL
jgi:hypothetical protein